MKHCEFCGNLFPQSRRNQKYCTGSNCRRRRKREWQKDKLKSYLDYYLSQKESQARWRSRRPDYWHTYRENHPEYTTRNRQLQRERNRRRSRNQNGMIAKMDTKVPYFSGTYYLIPVQVVSQELIAKMDAKLVKIQSVTITAEKKSDCKERTHTHRGQKMGMLYDRE